MEVFWVRLRERRMDSKLARGSPRGNTKRVGQAGGCSIANSEPPQDPNAELPSPDGELPFDHGL